MTSEMRGTISFVVNSLSEQRVSEFRENLRTALAPEAPDVIVVPDAVSMAEGLNRGARAARGDWLVFCHDDIRVIGSLKSVLSNAMATTDMFGPCGTVSLTSGNWYDAGQPYVFGHVIARDLQHPGQFELQLFGASETGIQPGGQALDGIWIACRRSLFDALQGFDQQTYTGFVGYDIDFSFRAFLAGARVGIACDLTLFHDSHVGEFSEAKMSAWESAQKAFIERFGRHLSSMSGTRTHENIRIDRPEDALTYLAEHKPKLQKQKPVTRFANWFRK